MPVLPPLQMLFTDHDVRGLTPHPLDPDSVWRIGFSATTYLRSNLAGYDRSDPNVNRLIVAHDGRPPHQTLYPALRNGVLSSDVGVLDLGEADWPQLCYAVQKLKTAGGLMLTAGALPVGFAGLRFVGQRAKPITKETGLIEISRIAERVMAHGKPPNQQASPYSIQNDYRAELWRWPPKPSSRPLTVLYDSLGGVMARMVPQLLGQTPGLLLMPAGPPPNLGLRTSAPPDPRLPENLSHLAGEVVRQHADLGVAFDGDGQRAFFCTAQGQYLADSAVFLRLLPLVVQDHPGFSVVTEAALAREVETMVARLGGRVIPQRRGRSFFFKTMVENHALLGADSSGRFFFGELGGLESPLAALAGLIHTLTPSADAPPPQSTAQPAPANT